MLKIFQAETDKDIITAKILFAEYADFLRKEFSHLMDLPWFIQYMQNYEEEIANLPEGYKKPEGCIFLAEYDGEKIGCVGISKMDNNNCEMKRLYIRPEYRGMKIGKALGEKIITKARQLGYHNMRLCTNHLLQAAINLYTSLGFKKIDPYTEVPIEGEYFFELLLK